MASEKIDFRAVPPLDTELASRRRDTAGSGTVAAEGLNRYFTLLAAELREITLTRGEALLLCDVLNGTLADHPMWARAGNQLLAAELEDSAPDGYAEKWEVELTAFVDRVRGWTRTQALAVTDAVERFWSGGNQTDTDAQLVAVGLLRPPVAQPVPQG